MVHVRRMVSFDPVWDPTLVWYERAVAAMQQRPVSNVTSWAYQAAIHGTTRRRSRRSWNSCEHGGWYFFPWHRAYLAGFERIVRAEVVAQGGPADWALPYWDYERPQRDSLPPAFRAPTRADGARNALFTTERLPQVNAGTPLSSLLSVLGPGATLSSAAGLAEPTYSSGVANGFGGGPTPSSFQADKPSDIEAFLHGNVHVLVGLGGGWMSAFKTAAQDPVFWLHHANIDRLWAAWASKPDHVNPTGRWLTQHWTFFGPTKARVDTTASDVVDTVGSLDYRYDIVPAAVRHDVEPDAGPRVAAMAEGDVGEEGERALQPVGWSDHVTLSGHEVNAALPIDRASVERLALPGLDAAGAGQRCYLELSEIDADTAPGILYGVYLHGRSHAASDDALVGVVSFFGAEHTSGRRDRHQHRLRYVFDVTDAAAALGVGPGHGSEGVTVSFRPLGPAQLAAHEGLDADEPDVGPVSIGRVALLMG
jgi:Common central domain of tyrosinase